MTGLLANAGALLPEFRNWSGMVEGTHASIHGALTQEGTHQLISLLVIDTSLLQTFSQRGPPRTASR